MATSQERVPVASVGGRDGVPDDRALTALRAFGKNWAPLLVSAVTLLGAFAAGLGWIDSRMGSRMDRMEERIGRIEARLDHRMGEFEARLDHRMREFEARMEARLDQRLREFEARMEARLDQRLREFEVRFEQRFAEIDARFEAMDRRFERLEEAVRDIAERLARVEGHLGISRPGGERDVRGAALRAAPAARAAPPTRRRTGRPAPATPRCSE